jgi:hypothetical protein
MRRIGSSTVSLAMSATALFVALGGTALAVSQIGTNQIKNGAVTTSKLHDKAVTNAKLGHNAVGNGKLLNDAVTSSKVKDGSLTASDVAPGTFVQGLGFAPASRHLVPIGGSGITIFASGFGSVTGNCSNNQSPTPTMSFTPTVSNENFSALVWSDGGAQTLDTENAIGAGTTHPIANPGGRQRVEFQIGYDGGGEDHLATATITSEGLFGTGCLFLAQGLTTG